MYDVPGVNFVSVVSRADPVKGHLDREIIELRIGRNHQRPAAFIGKCNCVRIPEREPSRSLELRDPLP